MEYVEHVHNLYMYSIDQFDRVWSKFKVFFFLSLLHSGLCVNGGKEMPEKDMYVYRTVLCVGLQSLDLLNLFIRIHPFHPQPYVPEARIGRSLDASSSIIRSFFPSLAFPSLRNSLC
jgi:hypothetical protein